MEIKSIGILLSCLAILTFAVVKAMEETARYISDGTFDFIGWFIYLLIFLVFLVGIILILKRK
ncbi:hypothetical protein [Rossellomorea aquimaris]|uniref:hypothetical protein n=1 Tax=Rossellomorea aquimaris TaxID=189382 RepID=UPI0007D07637|nr:hypothetical protein [Rossellomorea aquimaris]